MGRNLDPFFDDLKRGIRGGGFNDGTTASPLSLFQTQYDPTTLSVDFGFRMAAVPEPATILLALIAGIAAAGGRLVRTNRRNRNGLLLLMGVLTWTAAAPETARAQYTLTTLAAFGNTNGATPYCDLTADANGNLYGTNLIGNVFKIDTVSYALTTLANVNSIGAVLPYAGLISDAAGNLYGTTYGGGIYDGMYGRGVVFKVAVGTHEISTMASFNGDNGQNPYCKLIADSNGNLYGTTFAGGASNLGTVFKVSAGMHTIETLATFDGDNGAKPIAGLVADANGN